MLLEANERLVLAAVMAQSRTEAAESASMELSYLAEHDFLTGLPNRSLLTDRLTQALAFAERHGKRVALMFLDIDHFKRINDSLGHGAGDQVLQSIARRLQRCVRHSDTVTRQGGDEFVVLLPAIEDLEDAAHLAAKLLEVMALPHYLGSSKRNVTLSIGISLYPDDAKDVASILRNADTAMYHVKKHGRNGYRVYNPDMAAPRPRRGSIKRRVLEQEALGSRTALQEGP
jgi:diguanylate cyclase (GGDEF)-like protein